MKDFFISYTSVDKYWAEWIAWVLEEGGYTVVLQEWDFRPGSNFVLEMQKAVKESDRTIAVLTPSFLEASYTSPEWAAAFAKDPEGTKKNLVPVKVQGCTPEGLLKTIIHIDLVGHDEETAREKLLEGMKSSRAKPNQPPIYPGIPETPSAGEPRPFPPSALDAGLRSLEKFLSERNQEVRLRLAALRTAGVQLRNRGRNLESAAQVPEWIEGVLAWDQEVQSEIRTIDPADAEWFATLDAVPPPRVTLSKPLGELHSKHYREHDFRLVKLEKLVIKYGVSQ